MSRPGWPYREEFQCHRCGNCCRGDGFVEITERDADRAAAALGIDTERFLDDYCQYSGTFPTHLKDQEDELISCIFLFQDDQGLYGCQIHEAKPTQCAGFPFEWRPRDVLQFCEGMRAMEGLPPAKRLTMNRRSDPGATR